MILCPWYLIPDTCFPDRKWKWWSQERKRKWFPEQLTHCRIQQKIARTLVKQVEAGSGKVFDFIVAVVVAQLAERSLPIPELRGLNPVIGKILFWIFAVSCIGKMKIKKKRTGMAHFLKVNHFRHTSSEAVLVFISRWRSQLWSSGNERRLTSRGCGFESQHRILDGHFSHYIVAKNEKEAGNGFYK